MPMIELALEGKLSMIADPLNPLPKNLSKSSPKDLQRRQLQAFRAHMKRKNR